MEEWEGKTSERQKDPPHPTEEEVAPRHASLYGTSLAQTLSKVHRPDLWWTGWGGGYWVRETLVCRDRLWLLCAFSGSRKGIILAPK